VSWLVFATPCNCSAPQHLRALIFVVTRATLCQRGISYGPVSVCPSVCLSQTGIIVFKRLNGLSSFWHTRDSLDISDTVFHGFKEIREISRNTVVASTGTSFRNSFVVSDFGFREEFRHGIPTVAVVTSAVNG